MTKIPDEAVKVPLRPLALGEKTGHHHSLAGSVLELEEAAELFELQNHAGTTTYLKVSADGVSIQHQEHKSHGVEPGEYRVVIQRENTDWGAVPVKD